MIFIVITFSICYLNFHALGLVYLLWAYTWYEGCVQRCGLNLSLAREEEWDLVDTNDPSIYLWLYSLL
jgi:hypothetical protein